MAIISLVYSPFPSMKAARSAAKLLVEKRLAACINIFAVSSIYEWKGKVEEQREWVLLAKALPGKEKAVRAFIEKAHPYSVPAILSFRASANSKYFKWARAQSQHI
ncbi:MAG: divalent-cation tolerance protein CutA [Candidatus Micrarchaeota archaeon]|nr:divalent-cation tolerance protein CutA [Candidatus Micrarchaeota archaeon]